MSIHKHLTPNDFILIIRPILVDTTEEDLEEEKEDTAPLQQWTGEVQIGIVADENNTSLSEEDFSNMVALCNCTAASIPAMEENNFLREIVQIYAQKHLIVPVPESLKTYKDNVLTLATNTKGNA